MDLALFQDHFHLTTLTQAINNLVEPNYFLSGLNLFEEKPVDTTTVGVEFRDGQITLVASKPRGSSDGTTPTGYTRGQPKILQAVHLPVKDEILADVVQNIRSFGTTSELESLQAKVNERLSLMRKSIDATLEYHRWGALNGQVLDADGTTVLLNLFDFFGLTKPANRIIDFADAKVDLQVMAASDAVDDVLNGTTRGGFIALCGRDFNNQFHASKALKDDVRLLRDGEQARNDMRSAYQYKDITFYRCTEKIAGKYMVAPDEALLIPTGVDGMFNMRFAPGDYVETVNTPGLPYYATVEPKKHNKGFDFEAQSNPITWCSRPHAIQRLKLKA